MAKDDKEVLERLLSSTIENICTSLLDEFNKTNAELSAEVGLKAYIIREEVFKCCDWCHAVSGKYVYGTEPKDIYRRHDNCKCMVLFKRGKEPYQDVWSKKKGSYTEQILEHYKVACRAQDPNSLVELKSLSKSKVLTYQTYEEIEKYFEELGIKLENFENLEVNDIKFSLAGVDDTIHRFNHLDNNIRKIKYNSRLKVYGKALDQGGIIEIGKKGITSYGTGVHESIHNIDFFNSFRESFSKIIVKSAEKGIGKRTIEKYRFELTGNYEATKMLSEVLAYAVETEMTNGSTNKLSSNIMKELMKHDRI